jgi:hypothetical protein
MGRADPRSALVVGLMLALVASKRVHGSPRAILAAMQRWQSSRWKGRSGSQPSTIAARSSALP